MPEKLPEEFAPTGPKLTRFPIRPAPPIRPHLFPDEAAFTLKLAVLAGGSEFAAWLALLIFVGARSALPFVLARLLKPMWAKLGTFLPRPSIAAALVAVGTGCFVSSWWFPLDHWREQHIAIVLALALPALGDLCATCVADAVTVERRSAAYAWLDMAQAAGAALAVVLVWGRWMAAGVVLLPAIAVAAIPGILALRDRGTARSSWPLKSYLAALRTPLGAQLAGLAFAVGLLCLFRGSYRHPPPFRSMVGFAAPLLGMAVAARIEPLLPNAIVLPRSIAVLAAAAVVIPWQPVKLFALGAMLAALPAAVARGAGEMERPVVSSVAWSALTAGAALGSVLRF